MKTAVKLLSLACLTLWGVVGLGLPAHAQDKKKLDSLHQVYKKAKHDTIRIKILGNIGNQYMYDYPDTTIAIAKQMQSIATKANYGVGKLAALSILFGCYFIKGETTKSKTYAQEMLALAESLHDTHGVSVSYSALGHLYRHEGNLALSLEFYQKGLKIHEELHDSVRILSALNNIGHLFQALGEHQKSLNYYQRAFEIAQQRGDRESKMNHLHNLAIAYAKLGNHDSAIAYYKQALHFEDVMPKSQKSNIYTGIGWAYMHQNKYLDSAFIYLQASLKIYEAGIPSAGQHILFTYDGLANMHRYRKEYTQAIEYAQKGLSLARADKNIAAAAQLSATLSLVYKSNKEYEKALEYHTLFKELQDSVFTVDKAKAIANLEARDELRRKQQAFVLIEKDKNFQIEREKNAKLALEKQAEADRLRNEARQEKDKRKQDSLYRLAKTTQLEADKFLAESKRLQAESEAQQIKAQKQEEAKAFQQIILYITLAGLAVALALAYLAYRSRQAEKHAKEEITEQNEEIMQQREELFVQAEALEKVNRTKDKLFAVIAHDLRSPLSSLQTVSRQVDFLLRKKEPERLQELGVMIEQNSKNLHKMLDNLLNWALMQNQQIAIKPTQVVLAEVVKDIESTYRLSFQHHHITLDLVLPEGITVWADKDSLHLILRNLLNNALKFTPEAGKVRISAAQAGKEVSIAIADTGIGISPEKLATLFAPQLQRHNEALHGEKGIGLGLSLCYEFTKLNEGTLSVSSEVGKGTIFTLNLPA